MITAQLADDNPYRPKVLNSTNVSYTPDGERIVKCFCGMEVSRSIVPHLKKEHSVLWEAWIDLFIDLHASGRPLKRIMRIFRAGDGKLLFSWTVIERAIRKKVESGEAAFSPPKKAKINSWHPTNFRFERTTVWDFPKRGNWAVHTGDYRGNWPPEIPRNLISHFTKKGELVVDPFVGGGTTLVEAWLLGRRSIGLDLSELAIQFSKSRLNEMEQASHEYNKPKLLITNKPIIKHGDALHLYSNLSQIGVHEGEVKLICAHPPYMNSLRYTGTNPSDLALIKEPSIFYSKMTDFAKQAKKCLAPGGICAVLIGDVRIKRMMEPLGLKTLDCFLRQGFKVESIVIKTQHRDRSTEFYFKKDTLRLLLAHEYLLLLKRV